MKIKQTCSLFVAFPGPLSKDLLSSATSTQPGSLERSIDLVRFFVEFVGDTIEPDIESRLPAKRGTFGKEARRDCKGD